MLCFYVALQCFVLILCEIKYNVIIRCFAKFMKSNTSCCVWQVELTLTLESSPICAIRTDSLNIWTAFWPSRIFRCQNNADWVFSKFNLVSISSLSLSGTHTFSNARTRSGRLFSWWHSWLKAQQAKCHQWKK